MIVALFSIRRHSIDIRCSVIFDGEQQRHFIPDIHVPKHCCRATGFIEIQSPDEICSDGKFCTEHGSVSTTNKNRIHNIN